MSDRMALLEAVAVAARRLEAAIMRAAPIDATLHKLTDKLNALDDVPAEMEPEGEMVEVRADIYQSPACSEPLVCPSGFIPYRGVHIATIVARIPCPVVPEVVAEVKP